MKQNVIFKIILDIVMLILYLMLMFFENMGGFFHEAVGLGIGVLFLIHIVINRTMIKGLFSMFKNRKAKVGKVMTLIADAILTLCMPIVIITGVLIAKELFVVDLGLSWQLIFNIHNVLSYVCLGTMIFHVMLHFKYLGGVIKRIPAAMKNGEMKAAVGRFSVLTAAAVVLCGGLLVYKNKFNDPELIKDEKNDSPQISDYSSKDTETIVPSPTNSDSNSDLEISGVISDEAEYENNNDNEEIENDSEEELKPTLEEYLSELNCDGCGRGCSLLNPRCGKGASRAEQAEEEYYQIYGN